jgi:hypothetical protein
MSRPIVLPMDGNLEGDPIALEPNEAGWKDTVRADQQHVTRIVTRWAPQEQSASGAQPGQNLYDDMMRPQPMVSKWVASNIYPAGHLIAYNNINYRATRDPHLPLVEPPMSRFDLWERVDNNDGSSQPQIIYAVMDRVLHGGKHYETSRVHQVRSNRVSTNRPDRWESVPTTVKGQLVCCDLTRPGTAEFFNIRQNETEEEAQGSWAAMAVCHRVDPPLYRPHRGRLPLPPRDRSPFRPNRKPGIAYFENHSAVPSVTLPTALDPGSR